VFAFLFGLSMDYKVFILARMREAYDATGSTRTAVIEGIGRTGRLVTSAALILVLSVVAKSTGPQTDIKILATGLAAGIGVDATIVRCLLVPAPVGLFGRYNWWLPAWAARLIRVAPSPLKDRASAPRFRRSSDGCGVEHVADPAHGPDVVWGAGSPLDLLSQSQDIDGEGPGIAAECGTPYRLQQLGTGQQVVGVLQQRLEETELE
jgi:hypothetical protein